MGNYFDTMTKTNIFDRTTLRNDIKQQLYFLNCIDTDALKNAFVTAGLDTFNPATDIDDLANLINSKGDVSGAAMDSKGNKVVFDGKQVMMSIQPSLEKMNAASCSITFIG